MRRYFKKGQAVKRGGKKGVDKGYRCLYCRKRYYGISHTELGNHEAKCAMRPHVRVRWAQEIERSKRKLGGENGGKGGKS